MKSLTRRAAAIVLATALSVPVFAAGITPGRDLDISQKIVRIFHQLQKFFGVSANSDGLTPPKP